MIEKPDIVPIALIQQHYAGTKDQQVEKTEISIRESTRLGAKLIVLQELHDYPYFCQTENADYFQLAESIPGPSTEYYGRLAKELGLVLVVSLFEKRAPGIYHNTAVVLETDGKIAGIYRKMHIPDDPGYHEKYYFTPGDLGYLPISTSLGDIGIMICWDQWFPEAARLMTLAGADFLIYPSAIGWDPDDDQKRQDEELDAWLSVQRGHAIANGIPVIAVNRAGHEKDISGQTAGISFWGNSFACGTMGEILCRGEQNDENLFFELDTKASDETRRRWPLLRDRRIDSYNDLNKRFLKK